MKEEPGGGGTQVSVPWHDRIIVSAVINIIYASLIYHLKLMTVQSRLPPLIQTSMCISITLITHGYLPQRISKLWWHNKFITIHWPGTVTRQVNQLSGYTHAKALSKHTEVHKPVGIISWYINPGGKTRITVLFGMLTTDIIANVMFKYAQKSSFFYQTVHGEKIYSYK